MAGGVGLVADLVAPYIEGDAAFVRFVACTARCLVPHLCHHWERRFAPLVRALGAGVACFAVRVNPLHDLFGESPDSDVGRTCLVVGRRVDRIVRQLREAEDRLNEQLHPSYVTLETHPCVGPLGRIGIEWRARDY